MSSAPPLAMALAMTIAPAAALDNGLGLLPPMGAPLPPPPPASPHLTRRRRVGPVAGWGTWNLFGCWGYNWTEVDVRGMADALVSSGMKDAGYEYINIGLSTHLRFLAFC